MAANRAIRATGWAAVAAAALLSGCASNKPVPRPHPPIVVQPPPEPAQVSAAHYMEQASSSALFAVRASELAATRASDPRLQAIAQTIALDQKAIGAQLSFAGRRVNLLPSAKLIPLHQLLFDELEGSTDFDSAYRRKLLPILTLAERLHRDFAERGPSPTLRPVAEMAAPVTRRNLEQLGGKAAR